MIQLMARRGGIVGGPLAPDVIIHKAVAALANKWDGDETAIAIIVEIPQGFGVAWVQREQVAAALHRRGQGAQVAGRTERYRLATVALRRPQTKGTVSCVVNGWGDARMIEIDARELRWMQRYTAPGGSA
jgi:hypothetical protein